MSRAINSALQKDNFQAKKTAKIAPSGQKLRHGYYDGSHSEIEVAQYAEWGPEQIRERGTALLQLAGLGWVVMDCKSKQQPATPDGESFTEVVLLSILALEGERLPQRIRSYGGKKKKIKR